MSKLTVKLEQKAINNTQDSKTGAQYSDIIKKYGKQGRINCKNYKLAKGGGGVR